MNLFDGQYALICGFAAHDANGGPSATPNEEQREHHDLIDHQILLRNRFHIVVRNLLQKMEVKQAKVSHQIRIDLLWLNILSYLIYHCKFITVQRNKEVR